MESLILNALRDDPAAATPVSDVTNRIRQSFPTLRRDEVIGALSACGRRMAMIRESLHVIGVKLA